MINTYFCVALSVSVRQSEAMHGRFRDSNNDSGGGGSNSSSNNGNNNSATVAETSAVVAAAFAATAAEPESETVCPTWACWF